MGSRTSASAKSLSSGLVIGLIVVAILAVIVAVLVAILFVKRRKRARIEQNLVFVETVTSPVNSTVDVEKSIQNPIRYHFFHPNKLVSPYGSERSITGTTIIVSRPMAVSVDLAQPDTLRNSARKSFHPNGLPPSPRKSSLQVNIPTSPFYIIPIPSPLSNKSSSQEIVGRHEANGTIPRPFAPLPGPALNPQSGPFDSSDAAVTSYSPDNKQHNAIARISRSSLLSNRRRSTLYLSTSASDGKLHTNPNQSSVSVASQTSHPQPNVLKVRSIFTPLLPDELVLRPNERLTLITNCSDEWCIVGRKSPFYVPSSPVRKEFGQYNYNKTNNAIEIEIGAVPAWVFESGRNVPGERRERSQSLRVAVTMDNDDEDQKKSKDVVSWSNVY